MLELWGMQSTLSLPLLPGLLWTGVVAPDKVLPMDKKELFNILNWVQTNNLYLIKLLEMELFDHLTVCVNKWLLFNRIVRFGFFVLMAYQLF